MVRQEYPHLSKIYWKGIRLALMALVLLAAGCGNRLPESIGANEEIYVLAAPSDWTLLEDAAREIFEKVVYTPQEEKIFYIRVGNIETFERHKHHLRKNILVAAPLDAAHPTAVFLRSLLSPQVHDAVKAGVSSVSWKRDVWARDQILMVATGRNQEEVVDNLRMESDRLYRAVEQARDERVAKLIFQYGERQDVSEQLARSYGWRIRVPFGYRIMEEHPDSGFVVLAREQPNRWLFVYWEDGIPPGRLTPDWCIGKRNEIARRFFGGDRVVATEVKIHQAEFSGKLAVVLQGLWENKALWSGGPFKSYAFVDVDLNRFFWVDVGVFSPNKEKENYLRQVDLMAHTFEWVR